MINYSNKEKIKKLFSKLHLLGFIKILNNINYNNRHKKSVKEANERKNGVYFPEYEKLKQFHNKYINERCFIVCTGPSLTIEDINLLKNEFTFSVNSIVKLLPNVDWKPTFYAIQDSNVFNFYKDNKEFNSIENKFISNNILEQNNIVGDFILFPLDLLDHMNYKKKGSFTTKFSSNSYEIVYDGGSVTYSVLQLAYYMGFRKIYLLGCDCNYSDKYAHFMISKDDKEDYTIIGDNPELRMLIAYNEAYKFTKKSDLEIYNCTRGGKLEIFPRVKLEDVIKESDR